ncbi:hypothetical protein [Burkholderia glumae]|uniref:hypothetical protein n=1 Tax=Burkholderia glumae TaxID=337 RepID=UPI00209420A9|nr:hypothetical protein [Burkholderia glumae]
MPIDPLYADSTSAYLNGLGQIPLPAAPTPTPSTGLASLGLATSLGRCRARRAARPRQPTSARRWAS